MSHVLDHDDEVYSIDINKEQRLILYGGKQDLWALRSIDMQDILFLKDGYSDSIIFSKFVDNGFIIATLNGEIYKYDSKFCESNRIELNKDISSIKINDRHLYVSTDVLYVLGFDLDILQEYYGHKHEITQFVFTENGIYTISKNQIIFYSGNTYPCFQIQIKNGKCMSFNEKNILCSEIDECLLGIFVKIKKIKEIRTEGPIESIEALNDKFVVGGEFNYLLFINGNGDYCTNKIPFCNIYLGTTKILCVNNCIFFSTFTEKIGYFKIGGQMGFIVTKVGIIFDFTIDWPILAIGGENGVDVVLIEDLT